jgi:hypothetical protein
VAIAACILLVVAVGAVVLGSIHRAPSAPSPSHSTTASTAPTSGAAISQVRSATDEVASATSGARAGLASLSGFPTPDNVATVINPYVASLRLYEAFMSDATVPVAARSAASTAEAQVRQDVSFLETIDGLPPIGLGAFLQQFATDTTQLQTSLTALEQDLGSAAKG